MTRAKLVVVLGAVALIASGPGWAQTATAPAGKATPAQLLVRQVSYSALNKMPFMRVLRYYGELSGLSIEADWAGLTGADITKETPVSLQGGKLAFDKLMDVTLNSIAPEKCPLSWYLSGQTVYVTTQAWVLLRSRASSALLPRAIKEAAARSSDTESAGASARPASASPAPPGEINLDNTPLGLVMEFFAEISGVNFHVNWRSLEPTGIGKDTPITIKAKGISIARAMDLALDQLNAGRDRHSSVYWIVVDGVVEVATGDFFDRTTVTRVYDVGDLLVAVPNFQGPRIDLTAGNNTTTGNNGNGSSGGLFQQNQTAGNNTTSGGGNEEENIVDIRKRTRDSLIEIVKSAIGDDMWAPNGKGSITLLRDKLVITQTPLGFKLLEQALGGR